MNNKKGKVDKKDYTIYNKEKRKILVKKKYVTPEIQFIYLKVEERLMVCGKVDLECPGPQSTKLS